MTRSELIHRVRVVAVNLRVQAFSPGTTPAERAVLLDDAAALGELAREYERTTPRPAAEADAMAARLLSATVAAMALPRAPVPAGKLSEESTP
jgi:hypothetical protein